MCVCVCIHFTLTTIALSFSAANLPWGCKSGNSAEVCLDIPHEYHHGSRSYIYDEYLLELYHPPSCIGAACAQQPYVKQRKAERRKDRDSRELWGWLSKGDSFRDRLIREVGFKRVNITCCFVSPPILSKILTFHFQTAHGLVWDRMACKGWLWNADDVRKRYY